MENNLVKAIKDFVDMMEEQKSPMVTICKYSREYQALKSLISLEEPKEIKQALCECTLAGCMKLHVHPEFKEAQRLENKRLTKIMEELALNTKPTQHEKEEMSKHIVTDEMVDLALKKVHVLSSEFGKDLMKAALQAVFDMLNEEKVEDDGWIEWQPIDKDAKPDIDERIIIQVKYRNPDYAFKKKGEAGDFAWHWNERRDTDIIAYRIIKDKEPEYCSCSPSWSNRPDDIGGGDKKVEKSVLTHMGDAEIEKFNNYIAEKNKKVKRTLSQWLNDRSIGNQKKYHYKAREKVLLQDVSKYFQYLEEK